MFIGVPETARWVHGGAFVHAQPTPTLPPTISGNCNNAGTNNGTICPTYNGPPRRPEGLYQSDQMVGSVGSVKQISPNQVIFQNLRIASGTVDLSGPLEFQSAIVRCPIQRPPSQPAFTVISIGGEITCDIVGTKPQ